MLALTCLVSGACVWSAARSARAVGRAAPLDATSALRTLSRAATGDVEAARSALTRAGCPLEALGWSNSAISPEQCIPALNEHLGDISASLSKSEPIPRAAARISLFSGGFAAVADLARQMAAGQPSAAPLLAFAAGLAAAIVCWDLARRTARAAQRVRKDWDAIAASVSKILTVVPRKP